MIILIRYDIVSKVKSPALSAELKVGFGHFIFEGGVDVHRFEAVQDEVDFELELFFGFFDWGFVGPFGGGSLEGGLFGGFGGEEGVLFVGFPDFGGGTHNK